MLNRITSSIANCTFFGFIAIFCPPLYGTESLMAQSLPAQDEISKLQSEVSRQGKSPEDVDRAMRDRFPSSAFPYYEAPNGCSYSVIGLTLELVLSQLVITMINAMQQLENQRTHVMTISKMIWIGFVPQVPL
jgi:hypothetical protein